MYIPAYPNLNAEMARRRIAKKQVCAALNIEPHSLSNKLSGRSDFKLSEAVAVHRQFFPDVPFDILFCKIPTN